MEHEIETRLIHHGEPRNEGAVGQPGQTWARLLDFNNGTDGQAAPRQYLFLTPRSGAQPINTLRYAITNNDPGNEFQVNSSAEEPFGAPARMLTHDGATFRRISDSVRDVGARCSISAGVMS